ncbi:MAG: hypothetical protein LBD29_10305 [Treponema sp.]|nr:hypothetical protein [Treponema sp.]
MLIISCSGTHKISEAVNQKTTAKPEHYVFFGLDREEIRKSSFYNLKEFSGAQIAYTWKSLEIEKDLYDFSAIEKDIVFLANKGKKLFIQIMDTSFNVKHIFVPDYICKEPQYNGGVNLQYTFDDDMDTNPKEAGWTARRWDTAVANRFHKLIGELGKQFDGKIGGINFQETSVDFGSTGTWHPSGFTPENYLEAVKSTMYAARSAFNQSTVIQYANFMPGEWLPLHDKGYLAAVFEYAAHIGIGIGGPDIIPYRLGQMNHGYYFARQYQGKLVFGFAVQEGNYDQINMKTNAPLTVEEIYDFAKHYLCADYIFWHPQEPYFTKELKPLLRKTPHKI